MTKADFIFVQNIRNILDHGSWSEQARPHYANGQVANSKYITGAFAEYDLSKDEFPITTLRPIPIKSAIKELSWIYQQQTDSLDALEELGVHYWNDWEVPTVTANNGDLRSIGHRYGYVVRKHNIIDRLLKQLKDNPWNRRNVISLWDYEAFDETPGLYPCAFTVMFDVRRVDNDIYLDATLTQRSNDMLVAHHINAMQYVALQMMIACHFGWKLGKFFYFVNNLHIYDNQFDNAHELLNRFDAQVANHKSSSSSSNDSENQPRLVLNCPPQTNFYKISPDDFELINYHPVKPQLKFDLAI